MGSVSLSDVRKSYGATAVVHGVTCTVDDGEFLVVLGPSGCGKSTLLRMIAGLEDITSGEISIAGKVVNRLEPKDRDIAMVFQNYALYPHMSVFENMAYGLKIRGIGSREIRSRVDRAAEILGLTEYLNRRPKQLSGGQRQRVAMGRCIVRDPAVFLFDEPLSNLDAKLRGQMRVELRKLHRDLRTTSIYVTHDQVEAMTLGDRLLIMNQGLVEQIDTPLAIYERPASIFVGGFIGSPAMNFLPARVSKSGRKIKLRSGTKIRLPTQHPEHAGFPVTLGIRPEHLRVSDSTFQTRLPLRVELVEALGADTLVHGTIEGAAEDGGGASHGLTARLPGVHHLGAGEIVPLTVDPPMLHVFDIESGRRL